MPGCPVIAAKVHARVFAGPPWTFHVSSEGWVTSRDRGHRFCTSHCRTLRTWHYQVTLDDKVIATDNTGDFRNIFEAAHSKVKTIRQTIGQMAVTA